ncbi:putative membrane protein (TIGR04086 family) [Melghiribacillus thermohalophilus]|uniref:Putative membrane protein (TIGR04086 family) n=1 Tax=Melghiribacillus thermohalophilus TaxID=1324956 RepID=A0A4R3NDM7_9BACI|nr:putative membrane protein (TIGR04086 family) [Melghiribacillus thermohalophilus]
MVGNKVTALLYGWVTIFVLMIATSLIMALLMRFTTMDESTLNWLTGGLAILYLFFGGFFSGAKGKEKGWMLGALTGIGYSLFVFLYQFLAFDQLFTTNQWMYHGLFLLSAIIGGILGVNLFGKQQA